jgi:hypothetical protein
LISADKMVWWMSISDTGLGSAAFSSQITGSSGRGSRPNFCGKRCFWSCNISLLFAHTYTAVGNAIVLQADLLISLASSGTPDCCAPRMRRTVVAEIRCVLPIYRRLRPRPRSATMAAVSRSSGLRPMFRKCRIVSTGDAPVLECGRDLVAMFMSMASQRPR